MNTDEGPKLPKGLLRSLEKRETELVCSHLLQTGMVLALCILLIGSLLGHSMEGAAVGKLDHLPFFWIVLLG